MRDDRATTFRRHLTIIPTSDVVTEIERLRTRWDPVMAAAAPAHVSVIYPEEAPDDDLLLERVTREAPLVHAFPLDIGAVSCVDEGRRGVFFEVIDRTGALATFRSRVVTPPFTPFDIPFHITVVHPRTSDRGSDAIKELRSVVGAGSVMVSELCWTETTSTRMTTRHRFALLRPRQQCVAAVVRREDTVLLCHRNPRREWLPGVWDLPGGHVADCEFGVAALARELREELGIQGLDLPHTPSFVWSSDELDVDLAVWIVDRWEGSPTNRAPDEHDGLDWFPTRELAALDLAHPSYADLLTDALDR